jgi:peptidoglycan L-alanyl-D-glutamate endopeptidase CwlK
MKNNWLKYVGFATAGILTVKLVMNEVSDKISARRIKALHPRMRPLATRFLQEAKKQGINLRITAGLRTAAEQEALFQQGRTTPGAKVTNARAWQSYHNYGLAIDVVPMNALNQPDWNSREWNRIGQIGKSVGLRWGGDFKSIVDRPHFEIGPPLRDLIAMRLANKVDAKGFVRIV